MDATKLLDRLRKEPAFAPNIVHVERIAPTEGAFEPFPDWVAPPLVQAYADRGIRTLYRHQRMAADLAHAGRDVAIVTGTASGKTLAYNLPVLDAAVRTEGAAKALYLFPTKALSQDQVSELTERIADVSKHRSGLDLRCFTYDGDTPPSVRRALRERGNVVVTNPWMLHQGILPNHVQWVDLFRNLRYVVLDEVHTLSGVFGSHVANVLRRLTRLARHYGANPVFIAASASIGNPCEHVCRLTGRPVEIVERDDAPRGEKHFVVYNPPLVDAVAGLRSNALEETRKLAQVLAGSGAEAHQSIFFVRTRPQVELLVKYLKDAARAHGRDPESIRGYRGGYLPHLRREIERDLRAGVVKTVVSTNALELGVDIGQLDVAVLVGYPGTVASAWQQAGRAGRRLQPSLAVLVARNDPMDQYLTHEPSYLLRGGRERVAIDPDNPVILANHVKCAAFELPFSALEPGFGAPDGDVRQVLEYLCEDASLLHRSGDVYFFAADAYPAGDVSLEGEDMDDVTIVESTTRSVLGTLARPASIVELYEGAIYGHQGEPHQVERFDYAGRRAYVKPVITDFYTEAQTDTEVRWIREDVRTARGEGEGFHELVVGEVDVTTVATGFKKLRYYTRENVGCGEIHLPPEEMLTDGFGLLLGPELAAAAGLSQGTRTGGLKGLASLLRHLAPLFVRCQPSDLGTCVEMRSPHFGVPAITIFDRHRDGVGLADALYRAFGEILGAACSILTRCACDFGCPSCIGPPDEVGARGKEAARAVTDLLTARRRGSEPRSDGLAAAHG